MKAAGITLAAAIILPSAILIGAVMLVSMLAGGSFGVGSVTNPIGPPVNIGGINAPGPIVTLDEAVALGTPPLVSCSVSASILLAQQYYESGYNPSAVSPAGAIGLSQFEPGTFTAYDQPVPPEGAKPPTPLNPVDSAWAEARYLCSLGISSNATNALIAYNCGNVSSACIAASTPYAQEISALATKIATVNKGKVVTSIGAII